MICIYYGSMPTARQQKGQWQMCWTRRTLTNYVLGYGPRPLAWSEPDTNALVVHAGVWRNWDLNRTLSMAAEIQTAFTGPAYQQALAAMYGDDQMCWDESLADGPRLQAQVNLLTRMRACWPDGSMVPSYRGLPAETLPASCVPWFDMPDRRTRATFIVCGHWSSLGLLLRPDVAMIDCGCCFGGPLCWSVGGRPALSVRPLS